MTVFEKVWDKECEVLDRACSHRFRDPTDVSSRLLSYWQIVEGSFYPRGLGVGIQTYVSADAQRNRVVFDAVSSGRYKMICINDEFDGDGYEAVKGQLKESFEALLPRKCSFER